MYMTNSKSKVGQTVFYTAYQQTKSTPWVILSSMKCKCACHNKVRINYSIRSLENPMYIYGGLCKEKLTFLEKKESNLLQDLAGVGL